MIRSLATPRLVLRPFELADAAQVQQLFPRWEIVRFLSAQVPWPYPDDGALAYYRDLALPAMARGEEWHWSLRLKRNPDELIGGISLFTTPNNSRGFWIGVPWQRQGLMTEAVEAVTEYWFSDLGFPVMRGYKAVDNLASRRISEKCGMRVIGTEDRTYVSGLLPSHLCEITAEEWKRHRMR